MFCVLLQKNETFSHSFMFFAKERNVLCVLLRSLQKNVVFFAFFYVLCKRTLRSLRSFTFFAKERCVLCTLFRFLEKNGKEQNVLLGPISHQNSKKERKRTERSLKEQERTERSEQKRTGCSTLVGPYECCLYHDMYLVVKYVPVTVSRTIVRILSQKRKRMEETHLIQKLTVQEQN